LEAEPSSAADYSSAGAQEPGARREDEIGYIALRSIVAETTRENWDRHIGIGMFAAESGYYTY
jgi:hypothetical protein